MADRPHTPRGKYDYFTTINFNPEKGDLEGLESYLLAEANKDFGYYSDRTPLKGTFERGISRLHVDGFSAGIILPHYPRGVMELENNSEGEAGIRYFMQFSSLPFSKFLCGIVLDGYKAFVPSTKWSDEQVAGFLLTDSDNRRIQDVLRSFDFEPFERKGTLNFDGVWNTGYHCRK